MSTIKKILQAIDAELRCSSRRDVRDFNNALDENKWLVIYPNCSDPSIDPNPENWIYDRVSFIFSNAEKQFFPRGQIDKIENLSHNPEITYFTTWKEIAIHLEGTIWIETSKVKRGYIEPAPFSDLLKAECIEIESNSHFHEAITSFLGCSEDFEVDDVLDKYLESVPKDVLRLEVVFSDVERRNHNQPYDYGNKTMVIYYRNEVIGYMQISGRELLYKQYFTVDIEKYQNALKNIVDESGVYDKMVFNGVTVVSNDDADLYLGVPGITPKKFNFE